MMRTMLLAAATLLALPGTACAQSTRPPVAGGWSAVTVTPEIEEVAAWALTQINQPGAELGSVENVSQQVVAGMNYRMDLVLADGRRWHVRVYRRFDGQRQLTSAAEIPKS